ncbi:MAG: hypothetical protein HYZ27_07835, partial [Deltaproteobacteria bacterium]|nr:hypothetical protein [Deltaproteobacteria bacterium]
SIERTDQQVPDNRNIYGARMRADFRIPGTEHALFANYMQSRTRNRDLDEDGYVLEDVGAHHHGYGGGELRLGGGRTVFQGSGGYRVEQEIASGDVLRRMWHAEADLTMPLFGPHGLHLSWIHQSWSQKNPVDGDARLEYDKGTAIVEWDYASRLAASLGFEYDDEVDQPGVRKLFQFGDVRFIASPSLTVRALVGNQRGGLKCVNGVCRTFPPFAGARAELIVRY